jgi:hypothetical protein
VLWIRIGFNADPDTDSIQHFLPMRIRNQILGFDEQKLEKFTAERNIYIFLSNISIYLSLGLHKERPSYGRSLHLSKEKI